MFQSRRIGEGACDKVIDLHDVFFLVFMQGYDSSPFLIMNRCWSGFSLPQILKKHSDVTLRDITRHRDSV